MYQYTDFKLYKITCWTCLVRKKTIFIFIHCDQVRVTKWKSLTATTSQYSHYYEIGLFKKGNASVSHASFIDNPVLNIIHKKATIIQT